MALWINDGLHEAAQGIRSFLLVGQSNMAGRGDLTPENTITAPDSLHAAHGALAAHE